MNQDPVAPPTARDYLRILGRRWWMVVATIAFFTLVGVVYSHRGPTIYKSSAEVRFTSGATSVDINTSNRANSGTADRDVLTEVEVIKARRFRNDILDRMNLGPKAIKQANVSNVLNTNVIKITIGTADKALSARVANKYAKVYLAAVEAQKTTTVKDQTASITARLDDTKKQLDALQKLIDAEVKRVDATDAAALNAGLNPPGPTATLNDLTSRRSQIEPVYTALQTTYNDFLVANAASQPNRAPDLGRDPRQQGEPTATGAATASSASCWASCSASSARTSFELLSDRVRTRQDVERFSRLPVLAMVPAQGPAGRYRTTGRAHEPGLSESRGVPRRARGRAVPVDAARRCAASSSPACSTPTARTSRPRTSR